MKILTFLLGLALMATLFSCGGDDCVAADWAGTYTLDATSIEDCDSTQMAEISSSVTIATTSSDDTINWGGLLLPITTDCSIDLGTLGSTKLDGTKLEVTSGGCTAVYNKN